MSSPLSHLISITGTCTSPSGAISISGTGGNPPYLINWVSPNLGSDTGISSTRTGLSGTYQIQITDASYPINEQINVFATVSSGLVLSSFVTNDTTCGLDNGSISVTAITESQNITYTIYDDNLNIVTQFTTLLDEVTIPNLSAGTFNLVIEDNSGCSVSTGNFIINPSISFDFGFFNVPDTSCSGPTGKLTVTGQTGGAPYTYLWSNGQTGSTISGLTAGTYSCTVTNSLGCTQTKSATVGTQPPLGLGVWTVVSPPSCFASDGVLRLTITGGTEPYYYSGSNGNTFISYSNSVEFSGLPAGTFSVDVTDAALCKNNYSSGLLTEGTLLVVDVITRNSTCSSTDGQIDIELRGGALPYTYTLIYPDSTTETVTTNSVLQSFKNLQTGQYDLFINDFNSVCLYNQTIDIIAEDKFDLNFNLTGTTCALSNGIVEVFLTGDVTYPVNYVLSNGYNVLQSSLSSTTFTNLASDSYTITVTDFDGCQITRPIFIEDSLPLSFSLFTKNCGSPASGEISALITTGEPPYTITWSSNVGSQTGVTVTGLTAGTYSCTVQDSIGCQATRSVTIDCPTYVNSYRKYSVVNKSFGFKLGTQREILKLLLEGFYDLTSGNTGCVLSSATYEVRVGIQGYDDLYTGTTTGASWSYYDYCSELQTGSTIGDVVCLNTAFTYNDIDVSSDQCYDFDRIFYTGYSLTDIPATSLYYYTVYEMLTSYDGITSVNIDYTTGDTTILTEDCLASRNITIDLIINYDIACVS